MGEHSEYLEMLDLAVEGELAPAESRRLADHLGGCADCRAADARARSLQRELSAARVAVDDGFRARLMAALPEPAWAAAGDTVAAARPVAAGLPRAAVSRHALVSAAALLALLGTASVLLLTFAGSALPGGGVLAAFGSMVTAAMITGAGLLGASWSGVGLAVGELFASAPGTLVAFALLLAFLSGLLFVMLRRPRRAARVTAEVAASERSDG